jgi:hypothetical protein
VSAMVIPVHPHARYVVVIEMNGMVPREWAENTRDLLATELHNWWESGEKFYPLMVSGTDVRLERVPDDSRWVLTHEGHERVTA